LGHQGVGRLGELSSGVAQVRGIKGCGREDSNLHEYYLTRSLGDTEPSQSLYLLAKAGSIGVAKRHQTTLSGHGVPAERPSVTGMSELREAALHDFATRTMRCELQLLALRLLDAPPEFAVRRAMDLASLVLTLVPGTRAVGADTSEESSTPSCDAGAGKGGTE